MSATTSTSDHLHQQAFDKSLQANMIFKVADGSIIEVNRAACRLLGYSKRELLTKHRKDIFHSSEENYKALLRQREATGSARAEVFLIKKDGKQVPCEVSSVVFKDDPSVEHSILSIIDLSPRLLKQKKIDAENEKSVASDIRIAQAESDNRDADNMNWMQSVAQNSYDVTWEWDIPADRISFGSNYEKVFGCKLPKKKLPFKQWTAFFQPEERADIEKKINKIFYSEKNNWEDTYQFTCPDGTQGQVISRANTLRDAEGKVIRMIGVIHDLSKIQKLEGILEQEMRIKEKQIVEAIVEAKEMERSELGKELHDNINQLLGASMLYLDMARKDIGNGEIYLIHSSEYTLSAIEEIRKLSHGLTTDALQNAGLSGAIGHIIRDTMETHPIRIHCLFDDSLEATMSEKFKLNTFRILQEQLTNILKHAKASEAHISITVANSRVALSIADNGIGFDTTKKSKGIGIRNIISRAELYKGEWQLISEPGKGCRLTIGFPLTGTEKN